MREIKKVLGIENLNEEEMVELVDYLYKSMNMFEKHIIKFKIKRFLVLKEQEQEYSKGG